MARTMKIGLVLSATPGYSETFIISKIKALQASGFDVIILTQYNHVRLDLCPVIKGPKIYTNVLLQVFAMAFVYIKLLFHFKPLLKYIKLERLEKTSAFHLIKKIYLNSHLLSQKLDWLHFGFATPSLGSELVAKAIQAKMAVSFRGFDINVYAVKNPHCYHLLWKHVDKVHSISNDLLNKAYDLGLNKNVAYKIIPPGVDADNLKRLTKSDLVNNKLQIVTIARFNWIKGLDYALDAMKLLKDEGFEFEYHVIGSGSSSEVERYLLQVHQNELQNHVVFHGKLSHEDSLSRLKSADIYLQSSIQEGFCNAVLEAQALGVLCVVTDAGALRENVVDGETGWIVPKRNPYLIARKILEINNLPKHEKNIISRNAMDRVTTGFDIKVQQLKFVDFYLDNCRAKEKTKRFGKGS